LIFRLDFDRSHSYAGRVDCITLPVVLRVGEERVDFVASLDTGASHCLFQRSYAEALCLDVEGGLRKVFATATGRFEAYGHEVTISALDIDVQSLVFFFADVGILKNVLGRRGWLDRVKIGVVDHDQLLYVSRYDGFAKS